MIPARELIRRFPDLRIGVVGDLMADLHVHGSPTRLSREAPVVILRWERESFSPGGAANCAANLLALGARVSVFGLSGADAPGGLIRDFFRRKGADLGGLVRDRRWATITKTRILAGDPHRTKQQVIRIDREPPALPSGLEARLERLVARRARSVDAWLAPDYGYGAVSDRILSILRRSGRIVVGSSRYGVRRMKGLSAVTANEAEALSASGAREILKAGRRLYRDLRPGVLILTRGNEGMLCFDGPGAPATLPASGSREAVDVTGAGDTVSAVLTLALAAGAAPREAARLANAAAGAVVMRPGAATLNPLELAEAAR